MIQGLLALSLFFISILGILLFRPDPLNSITRYSDPAQVEERKQVTRKMVEFLEKNPDVVRQTLRLSKTSLGKPLESAAPPALAETTSASGPEEARSFPFLGQTFEFRSRRELNAWIYEKTKASPTEFIKQLHRTEMDPETKLELLTSAGQADDSEATKHSLKEASLSEARELIKSPQGRDQQLTQKYLELFIEKEDDPKVGKEKVDELLRSSSSPPGSP